MVQMQINKDTIVVGEAVDVGVCYGAFLCTLKLLNPIIEKHLSAQDAFNRIVEMMKSVKVEPIRKEAANDQKESGKDPDVRGNEQKPGAKPDAVEAKGKISELHPGIRNPGGILDDSVRKEEPGK